MANSKQILNDINWALTTAISHCGHDPELAQRLGSYQRSEWLEHDDQPFPGLPRKQIRAYLTTMEQGPLGEMIEISFVHR